MLRGINVSGHRIIRMEDLRKSFETLGFRQVKTYVQSGNVIFEAGKDSAAGLCEQIRKRLSRNFGFEVPVLLKTSKELEQTIHDNPFLKAAAIDHSKLHVTFLSKAAAKNLETLVMNGEQFYVNGQEIYLYSQMRMAEPNFPTLPSRRSWGSKRPQETGIQSMRCLDWLSRITPGIKANTAKNQSIQERTTTDFTVDTMPVVQLIRLFPSDDNEKSLYPV